MPSKEDCGVKNTATFCEKKNEFIIFKRLVVLKFHMVTRENTFAYNLPERVPNSF